MTHESNTYWVKIRKLTSLSGVEILWDILGPSISLKTLQYDSDCLRSVLCPYDRTLGVICLNKTLLPPFFKPNQNTIL